MSKRKITIKKTDETTLKAQYNIRTKTDWDREVKAAAGLEVGYDFELSVPEKLTTKEQRQGYAASLKKAIEKAHPTLKELVKVSLSKDKKSIMVLRLAPKDEASEDELENESEDQSKTESEDAN
jgi:hypothetical protein